MTRKALDVLGLPVVCLETGEEMGKVRDILCDSTWRVLGVVLQEKNLFQQGSYIPIEHIYAVGEDCVTVKGHDAVVSMDGLAEIETVGLVTGRNTLKGKPVMTETGDVLGTLEDVYFSRNWEKLVGYELSDGWIADLVEGRKRLPLPSSLIIGRDNLIVRDSTRIQA